MTLTDLGETLLVEWTSFGTEAVHSTLWSVSLADQDYAHAYQVGVKDVDGDVTTYVYDLLTAQQVAVAPATVSPTGAIAEFPWAQLGDVNGDLGWGSTLSLDGVDVATCPPPGADALDPDASALTR